MKFEFNWHMVSGKNYVLDSDVTQISATLAERSNVHLDIWNLSIAIVSLG